MYFGDSFTFFLCHRLFYYLLMLDSFSVQVLSEIDVGTYLGSNLDFVVIRLFVVWINTSGISKEINLNSLIRS